MNHQCVRISGRVYGVEHADCEIASIPVAGEDTSAAFSFTPLALCPTCGGSGGVRPPGARKGETWDDECPDCDGTGAMRCGDEGCRSGEMGCVGCWHGSERLTTVWSPHQHPQNDKRRPALPITMTDREARELGAFALGLIAEYGEGHGADPERALIAAHILKRGRGTE